MPSSEITNRFAARLQAVAEAVLPNFSMLFGSWDDTDRLLDRASYPAILYILSVSGGAVIRNGRIYERENILIAFVDKVSRDASGVENMNAVERMRTAMITFIGGVNNCNLFQPITDYTYTTIYESRANIDTGVLLELQLTDAVGDCMNGYDPSIVLPSVPNPVDVDTLLTKVEAAETYATKSQIIESNSIAFQLRINSTLRMGGTTYRYRLFFTSADGKTWIPANTTTKTDTTSARAVNQTPIDPHGTIVYYGATAVVQSGHTPSSSVLWQQRSDVNVGYSFNVNGGGLGLTREEPIYVVCTPQADGSAIIDSATPITQSLPTTEDGKIYIFLGYAFTDMVMGLQMTHPIYYYKDNSLRLWVNSSTNGASITIDPNPTEDSTNAVSSGGVYSALSNKQDTLTFDNTPTQDSTNPVTSGGLFNVLGDIQTALTAILS